jgi:hypothetical protein
MYELLPGRNEMKTKLKDLPPKSPTKVKGGKPIRVQRQHHARPRRQAVEEARPAAAQGRQGREEARLAHEERCPETEEGFAGEVGPEDRGRSAGTAVTRSQKVGQKLEIASAF